MSCLTVKIQKRIKSRRRGVMESFAKTNVLHKVLCGILGTTIGSCYLMPKPDPNALAPDSDWQGVSCNENNQKDLLSELNPTESIDGLLLYSVGGQIGSYIEEAGGEPCAMASEATQCNETIDSLLHSFDSEALITTQGDTIQVLQSEYEIKAFLGQLNNPQKVFSWMHIHGMTLSCKFNDSAVVTHDNGQTWDGVYTETTESCNPIIRERVRVKINVESWLITETDRSEIKRIDGACIGRKPPGALSFRQSNTQVNYHELGITFARHAAYEAASVIAFEHLEKELSMYGAPNDMLERIQIAAEDERRHAAQVELLAIRYGNQAEVFSVESAPLRNLESIAIDNMSEGCIGESWGALIGLYQAENAKDPVIAETMHQIALEEVEHASLSWAIHDWIMPKLSVQASERVRVAQKSSLEKLIKKSTAPIEQSHVLLAGLPEPTIALHLAEKLTESLSVS